MLPDAGNLAKETVSLAMALCAIPSPTGMETNKSWYITDWLVKHCGLSPDKDSMGNVIVRLFGRSGSATQLFLAHIDTVFSGLTHIEPKIVGNRIYAPSIGDNSTNIAALMVVLKSFMQSGLTPQKNLIVAFNVGREGLADHAGAREILNRYRKSVDEVIVLDANSESVVDAAVYSARYRIEVKTGGGLSYSEFGSPNAIRHAACLIERLYRLQVPTVPKTTYNIGVIEGGSSANTIAQTCSFTLDLRSEDQSCFDRLDQWTRECVQNVQCEGVGFELHLLSNHMRTEYPANKRLLERIDEIRRLVGLPLMHQRATTDCNIPLSMGIPSVCFGVYRGGGAHSLEEYIEMDSIEQGIQPLLTLFFEKKTA